MEEQRGKKEASKKAALVLNKQMNFKAKTLVTEILSSSVLPAHTLWLFYVKSR